MFNAGMNDCVLKLLELKQVFHTLAKTVQDFIIPAFIHDFGAISETPEPTGVFGMNRNN